VPDATITFLKQQPGLFRVFPLGELFMDNSYAAHGIQSIGGYSPPSSRSTRQWLILASTTEPTRGSR